MEDEASADAVGGGAPDDIHAVGAVSAAGMDDNNSAALIVLIVLAVPLAARRISLRRLEDRTNTGRDTAI